MVYGVHPYQLLNFNGGYEDVSTMAHESGHSMHSYLAAKHQPYVTSDYSIFVAEVASTLNENLLLYSMLEDVKNRDEELFILGNALENFRTTIFRQAMFAEFELAIHERVEGGQPLTGDNLNALYLDLVRTYYGHDEGVCNVDSLYSVEWAFIPHFYYNFYVYQYATSLIAGTSLAKGVREGMAEGDTRARDAYLGMLSAGSSKYPIDNLKDAGVDMTTSKPFAAAMKEMNGIMDRMETLIGGGTGGTPGSGH
jgi:oligoendopeptidase F